MPYTSEQNLWRKLLKKYTSYKCLWYKNEKTTYTPEECDAAWQVLIDMAKEIFENANKVFLQRRIKNFRTVCHREMKKVRAAEKAGKEYKPKIFYYDILKNLYDDLEQSQEDSSSDANLSLSDSIKTNDSSVISIKEEIDTITISEREAEEEVIAAEPPSKRLRLNPGRILARRMAEHLEKMSDEQSLIAEKIISDICVYGRLKQLSIESTIVLN